MTTPNPRIAIPQPTTWDADYNQRSLPQYVHAVEAAGGIAVPIPLNTPPALQAKIVASCSAVLLPGSPADVDPARYGQTPVEACAAKDEARESTDDLLLQDAFSLEKPILGICYGLQSLNVWRRGSLIQDLPRATDGAATGAGPVVNHQPGREVHNAHTVLLRPESRLAHLSSTEIQRGQPLCVNSSHHQAIDCPGEQLVVAAISPVDGVIEALEGVEPQQFVVAVQWHPERTYESNEASRALFAAFLDAAKGWTPSRNASSTADKP